MDAREKRLAAAAARKARIEQFQHGPDWQHDRYSHRRYESYEAYLTHQTSKLDRVRSALETKSDESIERFRRRFELLPLKPPKSVLCLGARLGQEVAAFISLGHFAVGNDINPGEKNAYVVTGDFHRLVFADQSVDCVYINSVDHVLDLERFGSEVRRVLKPDGLFVADLVHGYQEGFWAGEFEALHWPKAADFAVELAATTQLEMVGTRDLADVGSPLWLQAIYRHPDRQ